MTNFSRHMKDTLTYWSRSGSDTYGKTTFNAPIQIMGRWEDRVQVVQGKMGQEVTSRSRVFVDRTLDIDGYLFKGTSASSSPLDVVGAYEIQALGNIPDLRNLSNLNVAYL